MRPNMRIALAAASAVALPVWLVAQQVTFRSAVEMVAVNAQVFDNDGGPIGSLGAKDFRVWINGSSRKVASASLVTYPLPKPMNVFPKTFGDFDFIPGDVPEVHGRVFVLVVDEMSFTTQALPAVIQTAKGFLDRLKPEDVVGLYSIPFSPKRLDLTHFHKTVGLALDHLKGQAAPFNGEFSISASELSDITANDSNVFMQVVDRECGEHFKTFDTNCSLRLKAEADARAAYLQSLSESSYNGLRLLLKNLNEFSGPKTVVMVSAGLLTTDRVGAQPDISGLIKTVSKYAAAADATVYTLHIDSSYLDTYSAAPLPVRIQNHRDTETPFGGAPIVGAPDMRASDRFLSQARDSNLYALGLQRIAGEAGGSYLRVVAGSGEIAFDRILKETSAYYLLGVQPESADRDGRVHFIRVAVDAKNAQVRARQQVTIPKSGG